MSEPRDIERIRDTREGDLTFSGDSVSISFDNMCEEAGLNPNAEENLEAKRFCPTGYVPLNGAPPVDRAIVQYECNGHHHPVTVFAPKGTANYIGGGPVPSDELPDGYNLASALAGEYGEISANILYYPQSFCFHPGAIPLPGSGYNPAGPMGGSGEVREVVTLDTARLKGQQNTGMYSADSYIDQWPPDDVAGHGHAIADLIGRMTGDKIASKLHGMRPTDGHTYQLEFEKGQRIRAFSADMLMRNLEALDKAYPEASVLNLSLGAPNTPLAMAFDPVGHWIDRWIGRGKSRSVVAAAGNHQTCVPNWPAAHCGNWGKPTTPASKEKHGATLTNKEQIYSVGSESFYDDYKAHGGTKDPFSAENDLRDGWIGYQRIGREVEVHCPDPDDQNWTGTSFAAPQVAAELAAGLIPKP